MPKKKSNLPHVAAPTPDIYPIPQRGDANIIGELMRLSLMGGGATVHPTQGNQAGVDAFAVGQQGFGQESHRLTNQDILGFLAKNRKKLKGPNSNAIGTYLDPQTQQWLFDLVQLIPSYNDALLAGQRNNQDSIYDLNDERVIPTKGPNRR